MEEFIADIYRHSFVISDLKEFVFLLNTGRLSQARRLYNSTAGKIETWLEEIAASDPVTASSIQSIALEIKYCYEDCSRCKGIVDGRLIPALYGYISNSNTINVNAGRYTLTSSDTGFLTIKDEEADLYLHDVHDPMHEAYQSVCCLYKPEMEGFIILGCGLGYEAYQIYHQSFGAVKIYLYEEDKMILQYAKLYGVLSLIPDENIEVIHTDNLEQLAEHFINNINAHPYYGYHISGFKKKAYNGICANEINRLVINQENSLEISHLSSINLWKNRNLKGIPFSQISKRLEFDEYVVISAGPSLDDNIDFLKKCKGTKGLIAVNTVLRRLLNEGIVPDIIAAADPSPSLMDHLTGLEIATKDIILIADWVLSWKYTTLYQGEICFVRTNASAALTENLMSDDPVWDISGTVACLALETAVRLGAKKIYLVGQDLAYPGGRKYAENMPHAEAPDAKWDMQIPSVDGSMVDTCEAFDWFRKAIEFQIARYSDPEYINLSKHGALIKGAVSYFD